MTAPIEEVLKLPVFQAYAERNPLSRAMFERAARVMPDGVNGGVRWFPPFPLYMERAAGAYKWTVDGQRLVDFWMGHSALLLGHGDPEVKEAVERQLSRGVHFAAPHEAELELAERVSALVPHAEQIRFVGTGSEAIVLAWRLSRAATGKQKILRFPGHYHGWYDAQIQGVLPPYESSPAGSSPYAREEVLLCPANAQAVEVALDRHPDIAAVVLEPSGGSAGSLPLPAGFLARLRELASQRGVVLIFDEIITGFRFAPGGAAAFYGVTPDLSTFSKTLFGGMPGAAVAGRREIMRGLSITAGGRVAHQGTWNGAPLAMAAGNACLRKLADGSVQTRIARTASELRVRLRAVLQDLGVAGSVYGESSLVHVLLGLRLEEEPAPDPLTLHQQRLKQRLNLILRCAMLLEGVDFFTTHGSPVSAAHSLEDIETTARAFRSALHQLHEARELSRKP